MMSARLEEWGRVKGPSLRQEVWFYLPSFGPVLVSWTSPDIISLSVEVRHFMVWSSSLEILWGSHWEGPSNQIKSVKDSPYYFYRKRLDSAFAVLLVCPI